MSDLSVTRARGLVSTPLSGEAPPVRAKPADRLEAPRKVAKIDAGKTALRTEMLDVLHTVARHFQLRYGPRVHKADDFKWDIATLEEAGKKQIAKIVSNSGLSRDAMVSHFHRVLSDFVHATHDYHVGITFTRLAQAKLGFHVQPAADGRLFITGIDRRLLSEAAFPFAQGDELLSIDGRPATELLAEQQAFDTTSNALTDAGNAASRLTNRRGRVGETMPEKPTALIGIKRKDGSTTTVDIAWSTKNESVIFPRAGGSALGIRSAKTNNVGPDMSAQRYIDHSELASAETTGDGFVIGARNTFVPKLGPIVAQEPESSPIAAYIYRAPNGKNIGVVRIPEYGPENAEECAKAFAEIIARYEDATDALVIDQNNNPGGYFFYMMALLSCLSPSAMKMTGQMEAITPQEVKDAQAELASYAGITDDKSAQKVLGKTIVGLPVNYDFVQKARAYSNHIIDQWNAGKTLTDSFPLEGLDYVNPSAKPYTKPILCLVNANCYSCGDFFPAALQTNKRATIFGTRTAGAGGYVLSYPMLNGLGVEALRITGSIADRGTRHPDGTISDDPRKLENPIENRAVVPDVHYQPTASDMQNGFTGYRDAVNAQIVKMTS